MKTEQRYSITTFHFEVPGEKGNRQKTDSYETACFGFYYFKVRNKLYKLDSDLEFI